MISRSPAITWQKGGIIVSDLGKPCKIEQSSSELFISNDLYNLFPATNGTRNMHSKNGLVLVINI